MQIDLTHIDWTALAAIFTAVLAWATFWLAREARETRVQDAQRRKELAFRAAIDELADNILRFVRWDPSLSRGVPDQLWLEQPLQFRALNDLLGAVQLSPPLWERISAVRTYVEICEAIYRANVGAVYTSDGLSNLMTQRAIIDLYLKQAACYIACAAGEQGFGEIENLVRTAKRFKPMLWTHGSLNESQLFPPFSPLPPEPVDPACQHCKLEALRNQAREYAEQQDRALRETLQQSWIVT